jgi:hypothetical protein
MQAPRPSGRAWLPLVLLLVLGTLWCGTFTLSKIAIGGGVPPLGYAFWQALGPALLLQVCALRRACSTRVLATQQPICGVRAAVVRPRGPVALFPLPSDTDAC